MTRQATDQLYIDLGYLTPEEYYTYQADAVSNQTCEASVACDASVIAGGEVVMAYGDLTSFATISCTLSNIYGSDLFAFTNAQLSAQAEVVRSTNVELSTTFSTAIDGARTIVAFSQADCYVDLYASSSRTRNEEAAIDAAFSLTADVNVIIPPTEASINVISEFTQVSIASKLSNISASINNEFTISINEIVYNDVTANLESIFSSTVDVEIIKETPINITSEIILNIPGEKIIQGAAEEYSLFTPSLTVDVFKNSFAVLDTIASLTSSANIISSLASAQESNSSLEANASRTKDIISNINSSSLLSAPYLSFKNKRPHSAYTQGAGNFGLTTADKKFGTGSYFSSQNVGSSTVGLYIPTVGNQNISADEDFYISVWMNIVDPTVPSNGTHTSVVVGGPWSFGTYSNGSYVVGEFRYGSSYLRTVLSGGNGSYISPDGWSRWEAWRSGSTITFRFTNRLNVPQTVTATYSGEITSPTEYVYFRGHPGISTSKTYFDEFYFAKGRSSVAYTDALGQINDGALSTTQWLYHFNENYFDSTTGISPFTAQLQSQATLSFNASFDYSADAQLFSTFTTQADGSKYVLAFSNIQSEGFVVSAGGRIRPFADIEIAEVSLNADVNFIAVEQANINSTSTLTADATRNIGPIIVESTSTSDLTANTNYIVEGYTQLVATGAVVAAFGRIRPFIETTDCIFTLSADVFIGKVGNADCSSSTDLIANADKIFGQQQISSTATTNLIANGVAIPSGGVNMPVQAVQAITYERVRYETANISAESTVYADADVIRKLSSNLSVDANIDVTALRTKQLNSQFESVATELAAIAKIGRTLIDCAVDTTLTADAQVKTSTSSTLELTTNLDVVTSVNKSFASEQSVITTFVAQAEAGIIGGANVTTTATLAVEPVIISSEAANITATTSVYCKLTSTKQGIAIEMSFGTMDVSANRTRGTESHPSCESSMSSVVGRVQSAQAELHCEGFTLASGKVINLQASEIWIVPADNNYWQVPSETRNYTILSEDRTYIIED